PLADQGQLTQPQKELFVRMLAAAGTAAGQARDRAVASRLGKEALDRSVGLSSATRLEALGLYAATRTISGDLAAAATALAEVVAETRRTLHSPPTDDETLLLVRRISDLAVGQHRLTALDQAKASATEALTL